jgi:hypothetical protein
MQNALEIIGAAVLDVAGNEIPALVQCGFQENREAT